MKTILVPTDFSDAARNAAEYAVHFAKKMNARVLLFHAYNLPITQSPDALILPPTEEEWHKDNEDLLKLEVARLKRKTTVEVKYKAKMGLAVDEIKEEENIADFIVMGMTAIGKLIGPIFGSVTTTVLKKVSKPVIVVPERVHYTDPNRIVLATDLTPLDNVQALDKLKAFAAPFKSTIYIVNAQDKKMEVSVENTIAEMQLETKLKEVKHTYHYQQHEDVVDGINEFVKAKNADMVVVMPHHYTFFERLFHKSFSKKIAFHAEVPLLVLPGLYKA